MTFVDVETIVVDGYRRRDGRCGRRDGGCRRLTTGDVDDVETRQKSGENIFF